MSVENNPGFGTGNLTEKYENLPGSKEVERAVKKARREGESPYTREERVGAYLDRLEGISEDDRAFGHLKYKILDCFTIDDQDEATLNDLALGLYESEKRIAIEQGRGADVEKLESQGDIIERYKPLIQEKAQIQKATLTSWLDYLQQNDAKQPMWFRYLAVRNLEKMGVLDKEKQAYSKRTAKTIANFPELNSEALGWVYKRLARLNPEEMVDQNDPQADEKKEKLQKLILAKDFTKLYAYAQVETQKEVNRQTIEGEWRKYDQGSDYRILERDLRGKGTGWCTAEGSAEGQLQSGDFYVYYTQGNSGAYDQPRIAIRMEGENVGEVRGVNQRQELEPELIDIAQKQYHELPGGESYDKKAEDMRQMTEIYKKCFKIDKETGEKTYLNPTLTKDELAFLYEINSSIEGFGYEKDPRVQEVRNQRNPREDAPVVLDCSPEEIAWNAQEISPNTKAYVGPLFPGIFTILGHLEYIYTTFPEGKVFKSELEIGGKSAEQLIQELQEKGIKISEYAMDMLRSRDFTTLSNPEQIKTIRLKVRDLGFSNYPTTDELYARAQELGLELCPAEVGIHQRLKDTEQPLNEWYRIAMKQIAGRRGDPYVFNLERNGSGLWLSGHWARPGAEWDPDDEFVFCLRK